jgi:aminopeptidase N
VRLDGLSVDTDLRWALLGRLVSQAAPGPDGGTFGVAEIEAELARDVTDAGQRHAATCRAAIPTAEAKQEAWQLLTSGEQTIATFRASLAGFVDLDHPELIEPFRGDFFAVVDGVWRDWSSAMAQDFVAGAYLVCAQSQETVQVTDDYLARAEPPAALRRLLVEGRDDVLRSLHCQERDQQAE